MALNGYKNGYTELCKLALKWQTDKAPGSHNYTPYYHQLFKDRRGIKKILEIGIDLGRSLFMWQDYFPEATIYAIDRDPARLINGNRIKSYQCDQGDLESLRRLVSDVGNDFDFILDDGSHHPPHQIITARVLLPQLALDGIYIIEDVIRPKEVVPYLPGPSEVVEFDTVRDPASRLVVMR